MVMNIFYINIKIIFLYIIFLKEYNKYHAIKINLIMFTKSFHDKIQYVYIVDNYRHYEGIQNPHIKTICKPEFMIN